MSGGRIAHAGSNVRARPADEVRSRAVVLWHVLLCAIAALNLVLWAVAAVAVTHRRVATPLGPDAASGIQLLLCAAYVFGCAFRSVLPVYDIPRFVLVNSRLSSVLVGRSIATVAELCFAAQWALMLHRLALLSGSPSAQTLSLLVMPIILLAEGCSWYAVLTTSQRAHAFENSLWGVTAALVVAGMLLIEPHRVPALHLPMMIWCVGGGAYIAFIFLSDVPTYWSRWRADQANGHRYLGILEGVLDTWRRRTVSHRWQVWKTEMLWMSLYFAFGVWSSISLVYASIALAAHAI
jgi:hypothetical protein